MFFSKWWRLKKAGILGINARNLEFVQRLNNRKYYPFVDDKVLTKSLAEGHKIKVPKLYALVETEHDNRKLDKMLKGMSSFVIKPSQGAGGEGILVITHFINERYRTSSGKLLTLNELKYHVSTALSGAYSLGGHPDKVMIEYLIQFDPIFEKVAYQGVPDIRIIVVKGFPVMAMVRLPTQESNGKANLHQGAIGAGVNIQTSITRHGVWHNEIVTHHPDTFNPVEGIEIPFWQECLEIASGAYDMTSLGYLGVDIVLDKDHGPLLLELNARPGLNIQIANEEGLKDAYEKIHDKLDQNLSVNERVAFVLNRSK
ncbi:alpha-L-glutamate ligase-like protein [Fangia hongkongensis]|uniref:alpha-L-glutamate ligase-like protein n=1 Tax=Fangia hongkongensis TaxID=270495 RepID=UPI00037010E4|nr:alpha-L-glutamate ligase-like protein [Fangia hongkongensis]MBK2124581.1 alpha-L-glutamate ligase-like protein [Fangia hongkongensis]